MLVSQIASYILGFFFVMYTARYLGAEGSGINPFRKSVYKTFSFIKKASRKMLRTAITKRDRGDVFGEKEEAVDKFDEAHEELKARGLVEE